MLQDQQQSRYRKIAILGSAPSLEECPFTDEWEYWSLSSNIGNPKLRRIPDRWFELHTYHQLSKYDKHTDEEIAGIASKENMWMMFPLGSAKQFPRESVLNLRSGLQYYTSSIAWVLGLAILEKPHFIGLWGVDCFLKDEYLRQRPCIENLIGFAQGKGIHIQIPHTSPLCKGALYCDDFAFELQCRAADNETRLEKAKLEKAYYEGEKQCLDSLRYTKG